jgi:colanic acid biosynthesis glycosyl transferase WcaI
MKILILSLAYFPEITGNAPLVTNLAEDLAEKGNEVHVISGIPSHGLERVPEQYKGKLWCSEEINNVRIKRSYSFVSESKRFLVKIANYSSFTVSSFFTAFFDSRNFDVVLAVSPPLFLGITGYLIARIKGGKAIYNVQDLFPESAVIAGKLKKGFVFHILKKIENFVYSKADCITVICDRFSEEIKVNGINGDKIKKIPNWVDTDFIKPMSKERNQFRCEHRLENHFVVQFAGTIGYSQGLEIILEVAKDLESYKDIKFVIVGVGVIKEELVGKASDMALNNILFLPTQAQDKLPYLLTAADVSLVTLRKNMSRVSLPSKILGIMAAGVPIIASLDEGSEGWEIINESKCGITVPPEEPSKLKEAVLHFYNSRELIPKLGQNGREFVMKNYSRRMIVNSYEELFQSLLNKNSPIECQA